MILPVRRETLIIPEQREAVLKRLRANTGAARRSDPDNKTFMGRVKENQIQISLQVNRPENFIPQISGVFEETSTGCILFLKYTLLFSSRMFVIFWSLTSLFFAIGLWYFNSNFWLAMGATVALAMNIIVTHANFQRQYKRSRQKLHEILYNF